MSPFSLAVFDLDGTLLTHGALTREAKRALYTLRQNGIRVAIATGRHRGTVPLALKSSKLVDYLICSCGAVISTPEGKVLYERRLSAKDFQGLMDLGAGYGCTYAVSLGTSTYLSKAQPLRRRRTDGTDARRYPWRYYMYPLHSRQVSSWAQALSRPGFGAEKVVCVPEDPTKELSLRALAQADPRFSATGAAGAAEITKKGVSKGAALAFLMESLGLSRGAVVAFGNDDNDLSLQLQAGRFIAAVDSTPAILAVADETAPNIARAALRLCLGEKEQGR